MADFVSSLVDMGFERSKAEKAVQATGNIGVEPALDWIARNLDENVNPDAGNNQMEVDPTDEAQTDSNREVDTVPRSYKCDECGKQLKDATEMEFHAAKTGHSNFSESNEEKKPLTAEEKQAQLKRIEQKLKEKRVERELKEKEEALARERMRIQSGKELAEAKKRIEDQQIKEMVEARKRDKLEEKAARDRVRAQIEADKAARKAKQAVEQGNAPAAVVEKSPPASAQVAAVPSGEKKEYKETKIQLRLPSGKALVHTFGAQEPLAAVRLYLELNRDDGITGSFNLMTSFPRKVFEGDDYDTPLEALGLVPSAVLMVTRAPSA